jgi:DNA polymerase-4/DNA polymerase V
MYKIVRRYTPDVEEYSIDECFADIKGMRRPLRKTYDQIVEGIKNDLEGELGTTFSIGLAPNKTLAKVVSKWKKPSGLAVMPLYSAHLYLHQMPIEKVWGIGGQTSLFLKKNRIKTALDYAHIPEEWIYSKMTKPHQETWEELRGKFVYQLETGPKTEYKSISKVKTFSPPSKNRDYVFSQLSKNIENACMKARRYKLAPKKVVFFLKTQEFRYKGIDVKLGIPSANPKPLIDMALERFSGLFDPSIEYRSTGVVLQELEDQPAAIQCDLFGSDDKNYKYGKIFEGVDKLREKYGKHKVYLGTSLLAMNTKQIKDHNVFNPYRRQHVFKGETDRRRVGLPFMGLVS